MLKKVILSRSRHESISTHELLENYCLLVPESEYDLYKNHVDCEIEKIPDEIVGLGKVRNFCIDKFKGDDVFMLDDDIKEIINVMRERPLRISDPKSVELIIENLYLMAKDVGAKLFGLNQKADVRKFDASKPFYFTNTYAGGVVGVIENELRFTEVNKFKVDIDYTLKQLMEHRIILIDNRYSISQIRDNNKGGNSKFRTAKDVDDEIKYLKDKWGMYLHIGKTKNKEQSRVKVNRTQNIIL